MAPVGLILLLLAYTLWTRTRDMAQPGAVLAGTWGITLLLIALVQQAGFYEVRAPALLLFLVGIVAFVIGSEGGAFLAAKIPPPLHPAAHPALDYRRLAQLALLAHCVMVPVWVLEILAIGGDTDNFLYFALQLRNKSVYEDETLGPLTGNYLVLGLIVTALLSYGVLKNAVSLRLTLAAALPWVLMNLLSNGRAGLVQLTLVIAYLRLINGRKLHLGSILGIFGLFLLVFGGGAVLVSKGGLENASELGEGALLILNNLGEYALQGPILFSKYLDGDGLFIKSTWDALKVPCALLSKVGMCTVGSQHQDFVFFGNDDRIGNVYTVFFSLYPKYGIAGTVLLMGGYGAWIRYHHERARLQTSTVHMMTAGYLFGAVVLSIFSDSFLTMLNFLAKLWLVCWLLPRLLPARAPSAPLLEAGARPAES